MKKFYFLFIAMLIGCISASAVDYYLIGGFNGWALKKADCKFTAQTDGTYVLDYKGTLTSGFKINDGTWSSDANNFGGSGKLVVGQVFNLQVGGSSGNIAMDGNVDNPHIVFNPTAKTLLITGQETEASYKYVIHGDCVTGTWADIVLTEKDGEWVSAETALIGGNFGIKKNDATTGAQVEWISSAGSATVELNTAMPCQVEGINWAIGAGSYTFSFNPEAMTLTVTGEGGDMPTPDYTTWYVNVIGDFNSWKDNGVAADSEGVASHSGLPIGTSDFKVKIWNGVADVYYSTGGAIPVDEWVTISGNADANMTIEGAQAGEKFNVTYNCDTKQIKVTSAGTDPEILSFGLVGSMQDPVWDIDNILEMEDEGDGVYTIRPGDLEAGTTFKIATMGKGWEGTFGAENPDPAATEAGDIAVTIGEAAKAWPGSSDNFLIEKALKDVVITFVYSDQTDVASTVTVSGTSTSGIEYISSEDADAPVEYYNLNGVRVNDTTTGVYIRRQGSTVTKVIVK